ncbi:hypothetical protein KKB10_03490 [Patescibacteria group bacterium]|nr:hypothetical protein [Patescibacteria group bacterium]MBU1951348.1 hypothetical protein [Patescibacteria group bacterium]
MKKKNKKSLIAASLKASKVAVFCLIVAGFGIVGGIITPNVFAAVWQSPTVTPPDFPAELEPPLNTSVFVQEKKGGLSVATLDGSLGVGTTVVGTNKLYVNGTTYLEGNVGIDGTLSVSATASVLDLLTNSATVANDLNVNSGLLSVNSSSNSIFINAINDFGIVNIAAGDESGIFAKNNSSSNAAIQGVNNSLLGGTGVYGYGQEYGIWGVSSTKYGVLADARDFGAGGLYARGGDTRYGAVGRGLYGVIGLDNTEDVNNPTFNGPAETLAGLFEGSVEIVPSAGGNADLTVNSDTFVVDSSTNRVGIGTNSPIVALHTIGVSDQSAVYAQAGTNTMWQDYDGPTATVAGIYGEGGTVTYDGAGTGWNFGVFGKAGDPGSGRSVGIMGSDFNGVGDTYAGWFDGKVEVEGQVSVSGKLSTLSSLEVAGDMVGYGGLNLTGDIDIYGDITYLGKLRMDGGLLVMQGGTTCDVGPDNYAEGTMFVCHFCPTPTGQRKHSVMARMNGVWIDIGYTLGDACNAGPYVPET